MPLLRPCQRPFEIPILWGNRTASPVGSSKYLSCLRYEYYGGLRAYNDEPMFTGLNGAPSPPGTSLRSFSAVACPRSIPSRQSVSDAERRSANSGKRALCLFAWRSIQPAYSLLSFAQESRSVTVRLKTGLFGFESLRSTQKYPRRSN